MSLVTNGLGAGSAPRNLVLNGFLTGKIVADPVITRRLTLFGTSQQRMQISAVSRQRLVIKGTR